MKLISKDTLRALIKQRGLSYRQIGDMAGCHRTMISALVNGHRSSCTKDLAEQLAVILAVPREVIFVESPSAGSGNNDKPKAKVA